MKTNEEQKMNQQNNGNSILREKFDNDLKLTKLNQIKLTTQWRKIMRLVKTESLKKEIEILAEVHEKNLARKDSIIEAMLHDLQKSEEQIVATSESRSKQTKEMIQIQESGLHILESSYKEHVELLQSSFSDDLVFLSAALTEEIKLAEGDEQAVAREIEQSRVALTRSFQRHDEDYQRQQKEEIDSLRSRLEEQIEGLKSQIENTNSIYNSEYGAIAEEYNEMLVSDKALSEVLETRKKQVDNLQMLLFQWQGKMKQFIEDSEDRKLVLISEKRNMHNHYQALKTRIKTYRTLLTRRLTELSARAHECKNRLHAKLDNGQKVLSAAKATHDWVQNDDNNDDDIATWRVDLEEDTEVESKSYSTSISNTDSDSVTSRVGDKLNKFYSRYNKLLANATVTEAEKNRLRVENNELQDLLSQYEKASTFSGESVEGNNSLLIINGRSNIDKNLLHLTGTRSHTHKRHK